MKLEPKHIAPFLPFGVFAYDERQESKTDEIVGIYRGTLDFEHWSPLDGGLIENYKLVLRPMSDLYKPCLEGGKIPIVELAKIARDVMQYIIKNNVVLFSSENADYEFSFANNCFQLYTMYKEADISFCTPLNQLGLFQKLFEWHFNVFNLPEELFIDINTIK